MARRSTGKTARNERTKLEANSLNAIGLAIFAAGAIQPVFARQPAGEGLVFFLGSSIVAYAFHAVAQRVLGNLED